MPECVRTVTARPSSLSLTFLVVISRSAGRMLSAPPSTATHATAMHSARTVGCICATLRSILRQNTSATFSAHTAQRKPVSTQPTSRFHARTKPSRVLLRLPGCGSRFCVPVVDIALPLFPREGTPSPLFYVIYAHKSNIRPNRNISEAFFVSLQTAHFPS